MRRDHEALHGLALQLAVLERQIVTAAPEEAHHLMRCASSVMQHLGQATTERLDAYRDATEQLHAAIEAEREQLQRDRARLRVATVLLLCWVLVTL